ncbi:Adagio protein 2 [Diplonema papillatum]|nr:Adagio protein 2 [Diplonema papillatum]
MTEAAGFDPFALWQEAKQAHDERGKEGGRPACDDAAAAPCSRSDGGGPRAAAWERYEHASAADDQSVFLFGGIHLDGRTPYYKNDLWRYTPGATPSWARLLHANPPTSRGGHSASMRSSREFVVFGGSNANGQLNDLHVLDLMLDPLKWVKLHPRTAPPRRSRHTAALITDDLLLVHGGHGSQTDFGDVWVFSFTRVAWVQLAFAAPGPRVSGHGCCVLEGVYYSVGGCVDAGEMEASAREDAGERGDSNKIFALPLAPALRGLAAGAADCRQKLVCSGGWTVVRPRGTVVPCPRRGHALVPSAGGFTVHGGAAAGKQRRLLSQLGDCFRYSVAGNAWSRVAGPGAAAATRWGHTAASVTGRTVLVLGGVATVAGRLQMAGGVLEFEAPGLAFADARTGHSFGVSVCRHFKVGHFDALEAEDALRKARLAAEDDADELEKKHAVDDLCVTAVSVSNGFGMLNRLNKMRKFAAGARETADKLTAPCAACGSVLDSVLLPCSHVCLCVTCACALQRDSADFACPLCHESVSAVSRLFADRFRLLRSKLASATPSRPLPLPPPRPRTAPPPPKQAVMTDVAERLSLTQHQVVVDDAAPVPLVRELSPLPFRCSAGRKRYAASVRTGRRSLWCPRRCL